VKTPAEGQFELHRPNFLSLALPKETALARIWDEIYEQHAEADRLHAKYGVRFHIFKGIESDILADGSLDYPDDVMNQFDFVVASVHSRFRIDPREQT